MFTKMMKYSDFKVTSIFRCVLTPGDPYMPLLNDEIIARVTKQVWFLFRLFYGSALEVLLPVFNCFLTEYCMFFWLFPKALLNYFKNMMNR